MEKKSGVLIEDLSHDIKKKGLVPLIRDKQGLEIKINHLLNHKHFVINYRTNEKC